MFSYCKRRLLVERLESRLPLAEGEAFFGDDTVANSLLSAEAVDPASQTNLVHLAGEGFGTIAVTPAGSLAQLLWIEDDLVYRLREPDGPFHTQVILTRTSFDTDFQARGMQAQLLHRADGTPVVLLLDGGGFVVYEHDENSWQRSEDVTLPLGDFEFTAHLAADMGHDGTIHVAVTAGGFSVGRLIYGSNAGGSWQFATATERAATETFSFFTGLEPRYISLAVDAQGIAHIAYTPEFLDNGTGGFARPFNQLAYATNRSGNWTTEVIHQPSDDSGESGVASSIALAPNGQPAISHFFVDRVSTGSAANSRLLFHQRQANGTWTNETITSSPDGYAAGDGARFTGFSPHLVFDGLGNPHIAFSDHASQHFAGFGADEFAGQIRHATKTGASWTVETIFRQTDPLRNMIAYPTMAILPNELVFTALRRVDQLNGDLTVAGSDYNYVEFTRPQSGLTVNGVASKVVAGEPIALTVTRHNVDLTSSLVVTLTATAASQSSVVDHVTIPAGQRQLATTIAPIFSTDPVVTLSASANQHHPGSTIFGTLQGTNFEWHNTDQPLDVNGDDQISPIDVLLVINWLNLNGPSVLSGTPQSGMWIDVTGDGVASPLDALLVINHLNGSANAESESSVDIRYGRPPLGRRPLDLSRDREFGNRHDAVVGEVLADWPDEGYPCQASFAS